MRLLNHKGSLVAEMASNLLPLGCFNRPQFDDRFAVVKLSLGKEMAHARAHEAVLIEHIPSIVHRKSFANIAALLG